MNSFDEIQRALGPIPLGPVVGGKPLDGEPSVEFDVLPLAQWEEVERYARMMPVARPLIPSDQP